MLEWNFRDHKLQRHIASEKRPFIICQGLKLARAIPIAYSSYACCVSLNNQIDFRLKSNFHRAVVDAPVQGVIALNLSPYSLTGAT
jgi:hypothetical protein